MPRDELKNSKYESPYLKLVTEKSNQLGKGNDNYPYTINTKVFDSLIEINGIHHTNNPNEPSLNRLVKRFHSFIKTANNPIVFVEGGVPNVDEMNTENAVRSFGESGLITKIASESGIEIQSPEPSYSDEIDELISLFEPEQIIQFYFSRSLYQWYRNKNRTNLGSAKDYVNRLIEKTVINSRLKSSLPIDYDILCENFAKKYGSKPQDMKDNLAIKKLQQECSSENPVPAASNDIRDKYIFSEIRKAALNGRDVFIAYGSHHAFVLEKMLKEN